jgi:stress response protein YsnF
MNSQSMADKFDRHSQKKSIRNLLEILKKRVKYFTVIDSQGQIVGKVKDLILDANRQINFLIERQINDQNLQTEEQYLDKHRFFSLKSQKIQKIDDKTKSVFLDMDRVQIEYMPEHLGRETPGNEKMAENLTEQAANHQIINGQVEPANLSKAEEEKIIRLLEERLVIDNKKRKIGEVIVRKEIETRMIQVPVRREKLIVEQVSPEHKQLAEIDLEEGEISGIELTEGEIPQLTSFDNGLTVTGNFSSPKIASLLLNAIALERNHGCQQVRIAITVTDESTQKKYQEWFDRCSQGQQSKPEI